MWYNPPQATRTRLIQEMGNEAVDVPYLSTSLFISNMRQERAPWNDVRVREAFYRLSNRQQMVDLVFRGQAVVPNGPLHASLEEYQLAEKDTEQFFKNDVAQAKQLLEAANFDFGKEWEITINNNTNNNTAGEVWQQQLSQAGVRVRPTPIPFAEWLPNRVGKGEFDLIIGGTPGQDTPFRPMRNHHSDTLDIFNYVGLGDPRIDALIEKTETTIDHDENVKLVKELQIEVLKLYSGTYNFVTQQNTVVHSPRLKNFELDPLAGQVFRQEYWMA
jgi:peptide/nickel transport system substrate-binding protein